MQYRQQLFLSEGSKEYKCYPDFHPLKNIGCVHLLGFILPPFIFSTNLEKETQPIGFSVKNIQLIHHLTLHRCKHCYL